MGTLNELVGEVASVNPETISSQRSGTFRYVDLSAVSFARGISEEGVQELNWNDAPSRARRVIRGGDILVSTVRPGLRGFAVVPTWLDGAIASTGFAVVRPRSALVNRDYLAAVLSSDRFVAAMVAQSTGSGYPAVRASNVSQYRLELPPERDQREVGKAVAALDSLRFALDAEISALDNLYEEAQAILWLRPDGRRAAEQPLSSFLSLDIEVVRVEPDATYRSAGVLNSGKGMIDRGVTRGSETGYAKLHRMRAGLVVMRKLTAWEGPVAVIEPHMDGSTASPEFLTFRPTPGLDPVYFGHVCRTPELHAAIQRRVTGSVQRRKRLSAEQFLNVELPIPSIEAQRRAGSMLDAILVARDARASEVAALTDVRQHYIDACTAIRRV